MNKTRGLGVPVTWLAETTSTNTVLEEQWRQDPQLPDWSIIATAHQTAGRGRQGRGWESPANTSLATSVLVPNLGGLQPTWLPLIVGSAVVRATQPFFPTRTIAVKWPNDVHVLREGGGLGAKLNGVLCQLLADGRAIVGVGTNLLLEAADLPTERAGSWLTEGAVHEGVPLQPGTTLAGETGERLCDQYLAAFITQLRELLTLGTRDPEAVREIVRSHSATLATEVRVHLPGGAVVEGSAAAIEADGALTVEQESRERLTVHAGDVEHLREAEPGA